MTRLADINPAANPGRPVGLLAVEIGGQDRPGTGRGESADAFREAVAAHPEAALSVRLAAADDRPATRRYVRRWARRAGLGDWRSPSARRLDDRTLALFVLCGVFADDHPFRLDWFDGEAAATDAGDAR